MALPCPVDINNPQPEVDAISLLDIQNEMGGTYLLTGNNTIPPTATTSNRDGRTSINEYYRRPNGYTSINNTNVPLSGVIKFSDFYCTNFIAIVEITTNTFNLDVRAAFGSYWYENRKKILIIRKNVIVSASLNGYTVPQFYTDAQGNYVLPSFAMSIYDDFAGELYVQNYGIIMGASGKNGGSTPTTAEVSERTRTDGSTVFIPDATKITGFRTETLPYQNNNGGNGSHAIYIGPPFGATTYQDKIVYFENYGIIAAGGGGGGKGAYGSAATSNTYVVNGITVVQKGSEVTGGNGGYGYGVIGYVSGVLSTNLTAANLTLGQPGAVGTTAYEITVPKQTNAIIDIPDKSVNNIITANQVGTSNTIETINFSISGPSESYVIDNYNQIRQRYVDAGYTISNETPLTVETIVVSPGAFSTIFSKSGTASKTTTTGLILSSITVRTGQSSKTTIYNKNSLDYSTTAGSTSTINLYSYSRNYIKVYGNPTYTYGNVSTTGTGSPNLVSISFATPDNQGWAVSTTATDTVNSGIFYNVSALNQSFNISRARVNDTFFDPLPDVRGNYGGNGGSYAQTGQNGNGTYTSTIPSLVERYNRGVGGSGGYSIFNGNYYVKWLIQGECYPILDQNNNPSYPIGCGYRNGSCTFL